MRAFVRLIVPVLCLAASASAGSPQAPAAKPALPDAAAGAVGAFRAVSWGERCKPARPDPAPAGWQERVRAVAALCALPAKDQAGVRALLEDPDRFVRAIAAQALGLTGDPQHAQALAAALVGEQDKLARVAMITALGRTGGDGALAAVEAQQTPGCDQDISFAVGIARRQLKGTRFDVANLRAEFLEAARAAPGAAVVGKEAPELALPAADKPVNLALSKGRVVVLGFTHGDRDPVAEKALLRLIAEEEHLKKMDVQVIVVDPHEKERTAVWAQKLRLPFVAFASDPAGRAATAYGLASQLVAGGEWQPSPAWYVIDRKGRIAWQKLGRQASDCATLGELLPVLEKVTLNISPK